MVLTAGDKADVVVIGAGHNGLVAACYLARAGLDVLVVEAANRVGGSTTSTAPFPEAPDHRVNECATDIVTLHASTIVEDLGLRRLGYEEVDVDPFYVSLDADGASLAFWRDPRRTAEEIRRFSRRDAETYLEYARMTDAAAKVLIPLMLSNPTRPDPKNLWRALRGAVHHPRRLLQLAMLATTTAEEAITELFEHPMIRNPMAVYAGTAGAITSEGSGYSLFFMGICHELGVGRIRGGTQALPDALVRCLAAAGGRVRTSSPVEELIVEGGRVHGVRLHSGELVTAQTVVSSGDPRTTLTRLLPTGALPGPLATRAAHIPTTNGGVSFMKVDLALRGQLTLPRHQGWRSDGVDLRVPCHLIGSLEEMSEAFKTAPSGTMADPAPVVGVIPTGADPSQAPSGQDTLYLFQGWAPLRPSDTRETFSNLAAKSVLARADQFYEGIEELEIGRLVETWPDLAKRSLAPDGNYWHVDLSPYRMGPLRPARGFAGYRTPVPGLYLTGGGTHPGPSVSGIPGQLAARTVLRALRC